MGYFDDIFIDKDCDKNYNSYCCRSTNGSFKMPEGIKEGSIEA